MEAWQFIINLLTKTLKTEDSDVQSMDYKWWNEWLVLWTTNTGARVTFCEEGQLEKHYDQESVRIHQLIKTAGSSVDVVHHTQQTSEATLEAWQSALYPLKANCVLWHLL